MAKKRLDEKQDSVDEPRAQDSVYEMVAGVSASMEVDVSELFAEKPEWISGKTMEQVAEFERAGLLYGLRNDADGKYSVKLV